MIHFLEQTLSKDRLATYQSLAMQDAMKRSFETLYTLNLYYSKELYIPLSGLEITIRNTFNAAISKYFQNEAWFNLDVLKQKHQNQLTDALRYVEQKKTHNYATGDIIAHLNFGFWVHLCDRPYEQVFWNKILSKCFPYMGRKPLRQDIQNRLNRALILRNKIAHMEPIIKNEETLIQDYRDIIQLLYAICPQTQKWFTERCQFERIWNNRHMEKQA